MPTAAFQGGWEINPGNGHGVGVFPIELNLPPEILAEMPEPNRIVYEYELEIYQKMESRLGSARALFRNLHGNIFPHLGILTFNRWLVVLHPRGPNKTEIWRWCVVEKAAPQKVKEAYRLQMLRAFGPGGPIEQDDTENWDRCTASCAGWVARRYPLNFQQGMGHEQFHEDFPGRVGGSPIELNQRDFYRFWASLMSTESWAKVPLVSATVK